MPDCLCPWCNEHPAIANLDRSEDDLDPVTVCGYCAEDYVEWLREDEARARSEALADYAGPYYADTMSGGCTLL